MTFRELAIELMDQGWRAYHVDDIGKFTRGNTLESLAIRSLIEVRIYENKRIVFVKDCKPRDNDKENNY